MDPVAWADRPFTTSATFNSKRWFWLVNPSTLAARISIRRRIAIRVGSGLAETTGSTTAGGGEEAESPCSSTAITLAGLCIDDAVQRWVEGSTMLFDDSTGSVPVGGQVEGVVGLGSVPKGPGQGGVGESAAGGGATAGAMFEAVAMCADSSPRETMSSSSVTI